MIYRIYHFTKSVDSLKRNTRWHGMCQPLQNPNCKIKDPIGAPCSPTCRQSKEIKGTLLLSCEGFSEGDFWMTGHIACSSNKIITSFSFVLVLPTPSPLPLLPPAPITGS